jgi:hypothetical protein
VQECVLLSLQRYGFISRLGISKNQVNVWSVASHQTKGKTRKKEKDSDKERVIIEELEYYARRYGYPSPCGKVLGGDVDEEEKELFILPSHMDKKSVWKAIMAEKGENMFSSFHGNLEEESATCSNCATRNRFLRHMLHVHAISA